MSNCGTRENYIAIAVAVGIFLVQSSCSKTSQVETAINAIMLERDPADWTELLFDHQKSLEQYRASFGLPDISSYSSGDYPTVLGAIALRCSDWDEWDSAIRFANAALEVRNDPAARSALIKAATKSNNKLAKRAVNGMRNSNIDSLACIDLLIAQENYDQALSALDKLDKKETTSEFGTSLLSRAHITNRFLLIALRKSNLPAFKERLDIAWKRYFLSEEDMIAFCRKLSDGDGNSMRFSLAVVVRDMSIMACQSFRTDGNMEEAARWQKRAMALAEAIVSSAPTYDLHYQRVIKPKLSDKNPAK